MYLHSARNRIYLRNESETENCDEDDICPTYKCDLCVFKAKHHYNVAFHYGEAQSIGVSWEEAEAKCIC